MKVKTNTDYNGTCFLYGDGIELQIRYIDDHLQKKITERCVDNEADANGINFIRMQRETAKEGLSGWKGLTFSGFLTLCEPGTKVELDQGETWKDEVPFNDENKTYLLRFAHWKFFQFVGKKTREVKHNVEEEKSLEDENLGSGSGGKDHRPA